MATQGNLEAQIARKKGQRSETGVCAQKRLEKMTDESPEAALDDESLDEPLDETSIGPHTERVTIGQPRKALLCGAQTSAGSPCRRSPIRGGTKCALHGGGSPLARQAAERRLLYGVSLALDRILDALEEHDHPPCDHCGCSPSRADPTVLRAAIALLDRSGFAPSVRLQHSTEEDAGIREIRVNIIEPSPEQRAADEDSDREVAAMRRAERQANSVESQDLDLERKDTSLVFDLGGE